MERVAVSDTIPVREDCDKIVQLSVAPLIGDVIRRVETGESVSELFD